MTINEDILKAYNLGLLHGNYYYKHNQITIKILEKDIKYLRNKCKAERKKIKINGNTNSR